MVIGTNPNFSIESLIGMMCVLAFFSQAASGANFSLVPHINPTNNGLMSGITGAAGNLGGLVFSLILRFKGSNYHEAFLIMGVISLSLNASAAWIKTPCESKFGS